MSYFDRGQRGHGAGSGGSRDSWLPQTPPSDRLVREPQTGRYVRTPPARLPELPTQNGNDSFRSTEDLRGQHFDRIPPVRAAFETSQPRESPTNWGMETQSIYSDDVASNSQPQPYTFTQPPMYPVPLAPQLPGTMYYPPPMMVPQGYAVPSAYLHPQPHMFVPPAPSQPQRPKRVRYDDRPTIYGEETPSNQGYVPRDGSLTRPLPGPSTQFSYIDPQPFKSSPHPSSRRQYLIPSKNKPRALSKDHPYYIPSFDSAVDFLEETVPSLVREVVVEASKEIFSNYLSGEPPRGEVPEDVSDAVLNEVLNEEVGKTVRESIHELTADHLEKASAFDAASDLMDEHIQETLPGILEEVKKEVMIEMALDSEIIDPILNHLASEVAMETLTYHHEKLQHMEHKEVMKQSQKRVLDGVILDHLLASIAATATPPGESEQEAAKQITEQAMLTILLEQMMWIPSEMEATLKNKAIARHHEKAFMEVALDAITVELCATLDEDMADYDDYEQGLWNPNSEKPPEWALYTT